MCIINYTEMARVTGVPLSYLLTRGQQIKVMSQLYRKVRPMALVLPVRRASKGGRQVRRRHRHRADQGLLQGPDRDARLRLAVPVDHDGAQPVLLDPRQGPQNMPSSRPTRTPSRPPATSSSRPSTCKGILPQILEELLAARKQAKADMKAEKAKPKDADMFKYAVYDGRQLALKVSANSVYGFTGAQVGQLPCLEISSTVTAYGRQMIESTKAQVTAARRLHHLHLRLRSPPPAQQVEAHYSTANGKEHDAVVVYGDTDSVMIKFGTADLKEAMAMGQEAADMVTRSSSLNPAPSSHPTTSLLLIHTPRAHPTIPGDAQLHQADQARVREGVLPVPADEQEAVRASRLSATTPRAAPRSAPPLRALSAGTPACCGRSPRSTTTWT